MQKLIRGLHHFQTEIFRQDREFFENLAQGQSPETLFITCSDSRINPNLITQTRPGELFIVRNAGNIVPPHGASRGGEGATIEYAVAALGVKDIIVCGHTLCGAMGALLDAESVKNLPQVAAWLEHAESTRRIITENYQHLAGPARVTAAVEENALVQLENLRTHPTVAAAIARGALRLHAWVYKIETGEVFGYEPDRGQFLPIAETSADRAAVAAQPRDLRSI